MRNSKTLSWNVEIILQSASALILAIALLNVISVVSLAGQPKTPTIDSSLKEMDKIIPRGTPKVYGEEIGVKYDDVSPANQRLADQTIAKLRSYEGMELDGNLMQRYVKIASSISCEYCCGAKALIFSEDDEKARDAQIENAIKSRQITREQAERYRIKAGQRACGCAHSYAMRGLAKYLLANHGDELTDEQILEELGKWKVLFFPSLLKKKAKVLEEKGIELNYINLASNKYRGIENAARSQSSATSSSSASSSAMVGGC